MKLNIGSGNIPIEGFTDVERKLGGEAFPLMLDGVVLESNSVDEIRASHILEHFSHRETLAVLKEWVRVLKPNGILKIAVPDFHYAASNVGSHPNAEGWIMGGHVDADDMHGAIFTDAKLLKLMDSAGINVIDGGGWKSERWKSELNDCASLDVSLNIEGKKKENWTDVEKPIRYKARKIRAIMSVPRVGFLSTMHVAYQALMPRQIELCMHTGAFWEQQLTRCIENAIKDGMDDVLVLDYDSIFTRDQFEWMFQTWITRPDIDALCPLQPQRGTGLSMFMPYGMEDDSRGKEFKLELHKPLKVRTAHFGLTFLRLEKFKNMLKPWFWNQPSPKGTWAAEDGKVDADISFWKNWERIGNSLYMLPGVSLGHIEELIAQIDISQNGGRVIHRYSGDWQKNPLLNETVAVKPKEDK